MAKQKAKGLTADLLKPPQPEVVSEVAETPLIAMTLKLPYGDYIRLKAIAARRKQKGQAIMLEAVRAYLDRLDKA
jgi:hypothetical protein